MSVKAYPCRDYIVLDIYDDIHLIRVNDAEKLLQDLINAIVKVKKEEDQSE